jgi:multidrug efflux pump subunit AcrA (membrane-fusion protein)
MAGLVVMQTIFRGGDMGQVQEGDQVSPGQPFLKIVDVNNMQVEATVNQAESEGMRIGQRAEINFDAFPELHLTGRVYAVGALAIGSRNVNYYIRNVPIRVQIDGHDPRVIPDLSASADVVLERKDGVLQVPLEAVHTANGKSLVYVKRAEGFQAREVRLGLCSQTHAEIIAGLEVGEEVALQKPDKI